MARVGYASISNAAASCGALQHARANTARFKQVGPFRADMNRVTNLHEIGDTTQTERQAQFTRRGFLQGAARDPCLVGAPKIGGS